MSTVHGKWQVEDIKQVIQCLDKKTGLNGAALPIYLNKSLGEGMTIGVFRRQFCLNRLWRSFSFSLKYFNSDTFGDHAVVDVIRRCYSSFVVDELGLKAAFEEDDDHGLAWKTVCGLLNASQERSYYRWRYKGTPENELRRMMECEDIPPIDILEQLTRWGNNLPSLKQRKYFEKELIKKYTKVRVFSVNDRVTHNKYGEGRVLDTMPDVHKQRLFVLFDSGETRIVQNRQVYKIVNGKTMKPVGKTKPHYTPEDISID